MLIGTVLNPGEGVTFDVFKDPEPVEGEEAVEEDPEDSLAQAEKEVEEVLP